MEFFQGADPRTRSIVLAGLAGIAIGVTEARHRNLPDTPTFGAWTPGDEES